MGKNIVVKGFEFELLPPSSPPATITALDTTLSSKVKAGGAFCYKGSVTFTLAGYTGGKITDSGTGTLTGIGTINGTATKVKIEEEAAVLEGDNVTVTLAGTAGGNPAEQSVKVTIKNAGQNKAVAL